MWPITWFLAKEQGRENQETFKTEISLHMTSGDGKDQDIYDTQLLVGREEEKENFMVYIQVIKKCSYLFCVCLGKHDLKCTFSFSPKG